MERVVESIFKGLDRMIEKTHPLFSTSVIFIVLAIILLIAGKILPYLLLVILIVSYPFMYYWIKGKKEKMNDKNN